MPVKLWYFGTAAAEGWPALFCTCDACEKARAAGGKNIRTRAQALVDDALLMDFGPDTFYHAMQYGFHMAGIETVLLTHSHTDHFYPTELILRAMPYAFERDRNKLHLYGNEKCGEMFRRTLAVEDDSMNLPDCVEFHLAAAFEEFQVPDYDILPLQAFHDPKEHCLIYFITSRKDGRTLLYANDTGYFPEATWEQLKGRRIDLLSMDCTLGAQPVDDSGHMSLSTARKVKERLEDMGCVDAKTIGVVTHFSHNGLLLHEELEQAAEAFGCIPAYDGMVVGV